MTLGQATLYYILRSGLGRVTAIVSNNSVDDKLIAHLKKRVARRTGLAGEAIALKHIERVTWPDASLSCPTRGRLYAQVLTPGYRVVLSDGITDFEYHTDDHGKAVLYRETKQSEKGGVT